MAVFRVEKSRDYTVMSNYHLRDKGLSLKAKGLLSQMLSLPEDWDYTLSGLSHINRESKDAIRSAVNELEAAGYIQRHQTTDASGKFSGNEYVIHESPVTSEPSLEKPSSGKPTTDNPSTGKPSSENPTQLNIDITNTQKQNTDVSSTDSIPFFSEETTAWLPEANRRETDAQMMDSYRELIRENIEYDILLHDMPDDKDRLDEIVELMTETVCSKRKYIRIAGNDFPAKSVKSRFLKIDAEHIKFVFDCLNTNTSKVRNIKQYLLTVIYNAPTTIGNYYSSLVNHDLYGGSG
ncbi:hypothetical protein OBV_30130 [Oscillibacter valericigenes Sjm18-20]|nr:hypothetical protein OBV_30130 [Oscillibacter valericigenes Sjm18-20]